MAESHQAFRTKKRQTRLEFQPLPTSSPDKDAYNSAIQDRLANVRYGGGRKASTMRSTRSNKKGNEARLPTPEPSSQPHRDQTPNSSPLSTLPSSPENLSGNGLLKVNYEDEEDDDPVLPSSKRRRVSNVVDDENEIETPTRRSNRLRVSVSQFTDTTRPQHSPYSEQRDRTPLRPSAIDLGSPETSGDDDDVLISQPMRRRRSIRAKQEDPFVVDDTRVEYVSSEEENVKKRRQTGSRKAVDNFIAEDDEVEYLTSDDDVQIQPSRKRRKSSQHKLRSRQEQDEIDEDLRDLQDSEQDASTKRRRTRGGPVNTERERTREHFNALRRRRAGEKIPRLPDSDVDSELDEDQQSVDIENVGHDSEIRSILYGERERASSTEDYERHELVIEAIDNEDDFVIDDSDGRPLGRPHPDIPLAFTSYASRKPKELFVHVVEWLVKNKIAPAFSRNDELYKLSWDRVNDQIKAQAGSRLISSAWYADFKHAILARPNMEVTLVGEIDDETFQNCDACQKTNHPARYEFKFSGSAYHQETLEPIEDSDDEEDEVAEATSFDQAGHELPSQSTLFYLGRFCAANAEMGHKLTHWKYHLNESLLVYLEEQGVLSASAIVARDKLNKKKREREAESIVDSMEATGEIARLWQELQDDLEDARFGMEGHEAKGGRRSAARIGKIRVSKSNGRVEEWSEGGKRRIILQSDSEGE